MQSLRQVFLSFGPPGTPHEETHLKWPPLSMREDPGCTLTCAIEAENAWREKERRAARSSGCRPIFEPHLVPQSIHRGVCFGRSTHTGKIMEKGEKGNIISLKGQGRDTRCVVYNVALRSTIGCTRAKATPMTVCFV